jgi:outer membrane lipoprotein-sorting protein
MKARKLIVGLVLLFAAQAVSAQNNAEAIIRLMVNQMKSHKNVEMTYKYQVTSEGLTTDAQQGKAWLQGNAYKVEMVEQEIVSDGKTIWTYLVDEGEVMISNAADGVDNTPLKLLTSLDESYAATLTGMDAQGNATIELANPKGQYKRVTLKANASKLAINSLDVYLDDGTKLIVNIEEMKFDQELGDKFFTFDTKKHPKVDVIDMR